MVIKYQPTKCGSKCVLHQLESVKETSEEIDTEIINFNLIIAQLLKIVELADQNNFEVLEGNIIRTTNSQICVDAGIAFEIKTAKHLQERGFSGDFLLKIRWIHSELLVYSN